MSYRADLDALTHRHDALAAEVAAKTRELDAARTLLDEARERVRLPVLPNLRVAAPCDASWEDMEGDERIRACALCNKNVYNLSSMTRDEAEALIVAKEGKLCVRYYQRSDGTILLADCAVGVRRRRRRRLVAAGAAALLAGGGLAAALRPPERAPRAAARGADGRGRAGARARARHGARRRAARGAPAAAPPGRRAHAADDGRGRDPAAAPHDAGPGDRHRAAAAGAGAQALSYGDPGGSAASTTAAASIQRPSSSTSR